MKAYEATTRIKATPDAIWKVLVDGAAYPNWDSGVVSVEGAIAAGERIKVVSEVSPKRAFPVRVTGFEPAESMTWTGGMPLGLFRGVRTFTLFPAAKASTRFTMREEYTGPLAPLIGRSIPDLGPSFERFATGLKRRVEGGE